jgi:hypothetical protein
VEHAESGGFSSAINAEERTGNRAPPFVLDDTEVLAVVGANRDHLIGAEVAAKPFVEDLGFLSTVKRAAGSADEVMLDVRRVDGSAARAVARGVRLEVCCDETIHALAIHPVTPLSSRRDGRLGVKAETIP